MKSIIFHKIKNYFNPIYLEIINESYKHSGHEGSPNNGESHFYLKIKSDKLTSLSRLDGQRLIHKVLEKELSEKIHALRIKIIRN